MRDSYGIVSNNGRTTRTRIRAPARALPAHITHQRRDEESERERVDAHDGRRKHGLLRSGRAARAAQRGREARDRAELPVRPRVRAEHEQVGQRKRAENGRHALLVLQARARRGGGGERERHDGKGDDK